MTLLLEMPGWIGEPVRVPEPERHQTLEGLPWPVLARVLARALGLAKV